MAVPVSLQDLRRRSKGALLVMPPPAKPPPCQDTGSNAEQAGSRTRNRLLAIVWHCALNNYPGLFCRVIVGVDVPVVTVNKDLNSY